MGALVRKSVYLLGLVCVHIKFAKVELEPALRVFGIGSSRVDISIRIMFAIGTRIDVLDVGEHFVHGVQSSLNLLSQARIVGSVSEPFLHLTTALLECTDSGVDVSLSFQTPFFHFQPPWRLSMLSRLSRRLSILSRLSRLSFASTETASLAIIEAAVEAICAIVIVASCSAVLAEVASFASFGQDAVSSISANVLRAFISRKLGSSTYGAFLALRK